MTPMLDIRQRIKIHMIDRLRTLVERVNNTQEHMDNVSREMETPKMNKKKGGRSETLQQNEECLQWAYQKTDHAQR